MIYLPIEIPSSLVFPSKGYVLSKWHKIQGVKRVLFLNLMPQKIVTELDFTRVLSESEVDLQLIPIKIRGHICKNTSQEHMTKFYLDFEDIASYSFDRLIITGAPLEQIQFDEVRYWPQLCRIMDWANQNVERCLYICWAAQAGLYFRYGIPKYQLPAKKFGIYQQKVLNNSSSLMRGLSPTFFMPHSRHSEIHRDDIDRYSNNDLEILAMGEDSGVGVVASKNLRHVYVIGHLEYEPNTLHYEYCRDISKNVPIHKPENYYDQEGGVIYSWEKAAITFYSNWLI